MMSNTYFDAIRRKKMKTTRMLTIAATLAGLTSLAVVGVFPSSQAAKAAADTPSVIPVYNVIEYDPVKPSDTDGPNHDGSDECPDDGIGCEDKWGILANDSEHFLSFPETLEHEGKLLLFLCGSNGG